MLYIAVGASPNEFNMATGGGGVRSTRSYIYGVAGRIEPAGGPDESGVPRNPTAPMHFYGARNSDAVINYKRLVVYK